MTATDPIRQARAERTAAATAAYAALVARLADGGTATADDDGTLTAAGRDLEQLAADVAALQQHRLDLATIATGDAARAASKAAAVALGEHDAETERLRAARAAQRQELEKAKGAAWQPLHAISEAERRVADFTRERTHLASVADTTTSTKGQSR